MAIPCWKMMPALVTGNTVVFKPASDTPHCATLLVELMAEAGFPAGTVNLVTGSGAEVGDAIVEQPRRAGHLVHRHTSRPGASIAERAGRRLKRVSLELGGKNAVVVLRDADLDLAADGILWSAFGTTGQRCTACSRVIVERPVVEQLLAAPRGAGDGAAPRRRASTRRPTSGRSSTPRRVDKVEGYIDIGRREGELVIGGARATGDGDLDARPLLRADDLRRRQADGPDRPGGDLRAGPVGHPGRRLRRGDDGRSTRPATACRRRSSRAT